VSESKLDSAAFVVVDLETTGLDESQDLPLELGVKITDKDLKILAQNSWLIKPYGWQAALQANPVALDMHTKSGLVDELNATSYEFTTPEGQYMTRGYPQMSLLAWKWLTEILGLETDKYPMCGSSVHFDRKFTKEYLSAFDSFFTYRNIDVSTFKETAKIVAPGLYNEMQRDPRFDKKNTKHRVLPDIDATLAEFKVYLDQFIIKELEID
jgi:oligoribonuclease (3'-5' exoribonuclease)